MTTFHLVEAQAPLLETMSVRTPTMKTVVERQGHLLELTLSMPLLLVQQ
jgi:hypothetical protein